MGTTSPALGPRQSLNGLRLDSKAGMSSERGGRLGPGEDDAKEILVLNRAIWWTKEGLEYVAGPSQAERLLEGLGLGLQVCGDAGHQATGLAAR